MYKVYLADDRIDVIESIAEVIDWEGLNCELCGYALDGKCAYDAIESAKPDIIITDIKMPVMDGLELVKITKEKYSHIIFVILSGYEDFSYAQRAIRLGVEDYILKPVTAGKIENTIRSITEKLDQHKVVSQESSESDRKLIQSMPLLRDEYFRFLVSQGREIQREQLAERLRFLDINLNLNKNLVLLIAEMDDYQDIIDRSGIEWAEDYRFAIGNVMKEIFLPIGNSETFCYSNDKIALLVETDSSDEVTKSIHKLADIIKNKLNISLTVAISQNIKDIKDLREIFQKTLNVLSYKMYKGKNSIIDQNEMPESKAGEKMVDMSAENDIVYALHTGNVEGLDPIIFRFFEKNKGLEPYTMQHAVKELYLVIYHSMYPIILTAQCHYFQNAVRKIENHILTLEDLKSWMTEHLKEMAKVAKSNIKSQIDIYVEQAKIIIHKEYSNSISLNAAAESIGLSPQYLSTIFKEVEGVNFQEYLINYRIQKAKELLRTQKYKIYEVSNRVGYSDVRHFSEIFKKKMGKTPKEYLNDNH